MPGMYQDPGIQFDAAGFDPMRITPVSHQLMGHPLLELDSLLALAKRLEPRGMVRRHNAAAKPSTDFTSAPEALPTKLDAVGTLEQIETAEAWMALHNI